MNKVSIIMFGQLQYSLIIQKDINLSQKCNSYYINQKAIENISSMQNKRKRIHKIKKNRLPDNSLPIVNEETVA